MYDLDLCPAQTRNSVCTFAMPTLRDWEWGRPNYSICGDHSSLWVPGPTARVPFYTSQSNKILAIMVSPGGLLQQLVFVLLVPLSTILPHIHAARESRHRTVPWEEWGPRGARLVDTHYNIAPLPIWVYRAFGQMFVECELEAPQAQQPDDVPLRLYDCNPWSRRRIPRSRQEKDDHTVLLPETTTTDNAFFGRPVLTSLPCHVRTVRIPLRDGGVPYGSVMICEDALVAMSVCCKIGTMICAK